MRGPLRGPDGLTNLAIVTTGNHTVINAAAVLVKKLVGAATTVTLRVPATEWYDKIYVKDGLGDAATNNITILPDGVTATTIDGAASFVINSNYGACELLWNGVEWSVVNNNANNAGAASFSTVKLSGLLTESSADALTAVGTSQSNGLQLTGQVSRITAGASTTGVLLPLATAGQIVLVINDVANGIHVYGAGTDVINDTATATGITQPGLSAVLYVCTTSAPAGKWYAMNSSPGTASFGELPPYKLSTGTTLVTFTAAEMTGAAFTVYTSTAATPASIATPTATLLFAAIPNAYVGMSWVWRVINGVTTNSMTITADASVTLSGKTTYVATPFGFMDFLITFTSPTAATMQFIGAGVGTTA